MIFVFVLIALFVLILFLFFKFNSFRKFPTVLLISGAVKSGKSFVSVSIAKRLLFKQRFKVLFFNIICYVPKLVLNKFFKKNYTLWHKLPVLYSNIPLYKTRYYQLTTAILKREVSIIPKSIVFIDECSFTADSMCYKDSVLNDSLLQFVKLFGHMSHGGYLVLNTQSLSDLHYAFKRSIGDFYYIYLRRKLPLFTYVKLKQIFSIDGEKTSSNVLELNDYSMLISNKNYKSYDCYCYSCLTDSFPLSHSKLKYIKNRKLLKINKFVSFKKWKGVDNFEEKDI